MGVDEVLSNFAPGTALYPGFQLETDLGWRVTVLRTGRTDVLTCTWIPMSPSLSLEAQVITT